MNTQSEAENFAELAPFYVAGALNADEMAAFEAALARDPALTRNVAAARAERDAVLALNEALPAPSQRAADKLFATIGAEPASRPSLWARLDLGGRLAELFTPRTLGWAAAAACLIVAVQAGVMMASKPPSASYATASQSESPIRGASFALVAFAPGANAQAISDLLTRAGAQIVEGPRAGGFYRVSLGGADLPEAEAAKKLLILQQAAGLVRFAEKAP
jgi:anti-sigma factor RsiW